MALVTKILGKILGSKSDRDIKEVTPLVAQVKKEYERISPLSNDELRNETDKLRQIIQERIQSEEDQIAKLKEEAEEADIQESEEIYKQIVKLEEIIV